MQGQPYQQNPFFNLRNDFRLTSSLTWLLIINTGIWALIYIGRVFSFLFSIPDTEYIQGVIDWFALPANPAFFSARPWTFLTYMFLHIEFFHILFNLLWLFWFGKIFLEFLSSRQLLVTYLLGGLAGGLLYILFYNYFPVFSKSMAYSYALGASASVMAIVTAISFYVPRYTIHLFLIGKVKIVYIAIALFVLDFFMIRSGNAGGHIAHIGGAIYGLLFVLIYRRGIHFSLIKDNMKFFNPRKWFQRPSRAHEYDTTYHSRPLTDDEYNSIRAKKQKRMDEILDKISKSGYESLTAEEKEFLFTTSKNE